MENDILLQRCQELVAQLDVTNNWGLAARTKQQYAQAIAAYCAGSAPIEDARITLTARYYHSDHTLVEALRDANRPDHDERWHEWMQHALRILINQSPTALAAGATVNIDDLIQEALQDLWNSLDRFRFQSSFRTWAFSVISNSLARHYRTRSAYKRQGDAHAQPLDTVQQAGTAVAEERSSPDAIVQGKILADLVRQVLAQHPDDRLAVIFERWAQDDQTLREIGERMHLSASRVHKLLTQALTLLRDDPTLQDWAKHHWLCDV